LVGCCRTRSYTYWYLPRISPWFQADVTAEQINALLEATGNEVEPFYPIIFANYLGNPEKLAQIIAVPAAGGGGGGGGGGGAGAADAGGAAAAEEKPEEKEEEEMDLGGGMDMFGGEEGGGGGGKDY
jgi:large subunit ribosomal protein LP1